MSTPAATTPSTNQLRHSSGRVLHNAAALYAVRFAQYVVPFITLPYLARVLKPDAWGLVLMSQSFGVWLSYLCEYGFGLSATREIARLRDDPLAVKRIVSNTLGASGLLWCLTVVIAFGATLLVPAFRENPSFLWLAWIGATVQGCTPVWYFQGVEKMALPAGITLGTRFAGVAAILLFVRTPSGAWKVLAIYAVTALVGLIICLLIVHRRIGLQMPGFAGCLLSLRDGWQMFLFRSAASVYTTANAFVLGIVAPPKDVAYYGGAERVTGALLTLLGPLTQAFYPRMSHLLRTNYEDARTLARFMFAGLLLTSCAACALLLMSAPRLILVALGPSYAPAVPVLRVLSLTIPAMALQNVLGIQWMLPKGLDVQLIRIVIGGTLIDLLLAVLLAPRYGPTGMAVAVATADAVVALLILLVCAGEKGGLLQKPFRLTLRRRVGNLDNDRPATAREREYSTTRP